MLRLRQNPVYPIQKRIGRTTGFVGKIQTKLDTVEQSHNELLRQLPLDYVRREDHIRNESKLEAKVDAVYNIMSDIYKMESQKK